MTCIELKLAQTHVALTGPTRQQVLQLMMTCTELKLAQTHVPLIGPTREEVLKLMMTCIKSNTLFWFSSIINKHTANLGMSFLQHFLWPHMHASIERLLLIMPQEQCACILWVRYIIWRVSFTIWELWYVLWGLCCMIWMCYAIWMHYDNMSLLYWCSKINPVES